jgi:two-component system NtrC family sensor kinase
VKASNRSNRLVTAALAVVLLAVFATLYARTQDYSEAGHLEEVMLLRHLKQVDAQWELGVLRSSVGIQPHYDRLAGSLTELSRLLEQVELHSAHWTNGLAAVAVPGATSLRDAIQRKAGLIEQFKSSHSVLRNSQAFLPTAAEDVRGSLGHGGAISRRVEVDVGQLLLTSLLYSQHASEERGTEMRTSLLQLDKRRALLPPDARERTGIFGAHVAAILREQANVDRLLAEVAAVPTAARIDELSNALVAEQQRGASRHQRDRLQLLVFSGALAGLLVYAAGRLVRSLAEVKRVNSALQGANEHLEQRVLERTSELRQAQGELLASARQAGMAEIATNVLHNVGNVLNSVNVSAGLMAAVVRGSKLPKLQQAVLMINDHAKELGHFLEVDPRGRMLPSYLDRVAQALAAEQRSLAGELAALTKSIDHIKEVIATQQTHAGGAGLIEPLQIRDVLEDALSMNAGPLARQQVEVQRAFATLPELPLDRGRILQILVNLIGNAAQAMEDMGGRPPRLALKVELTPDSGTLRIEVCDSGVGIAPEHLTRMFAHGFTTKKGGHGFGLHSAANAAREMGGTLKARSDGPGTGATFTLELPIGTTESTS